MNAGLKGDLELGTDAVGGGNQNRVAVAARFEVEQRAKTADAGEHAGHLGPLRDGADAPHQFIAGFDANASLA